MNPTPSPYTAPHAMKISCYLIVKNEAFCLAKTLEAAKQVADEIIVVDSGSTDGTLDIARRYADKVEHRDWVSYASQKNFAQNLCSHDWLLSLDGDEVLSDELAQEINRIKETGPLFPAYNMRIGDVLPNRTRPRPWACVYNIIRLYHKDYATMHAHLLTEDRIEMIQQAPIGQLAGMCNHFSYKHLAQVITKLNKYTDDTILTGKKKKRYAPSRLLVEFPFQFLRYYFLKGFFLDGYIGFSRAMAIAFFRWVRIAKIIESEHFLIKKDP